MLLCCLRKVNKCIIFPTSTDSEIKMQKIDLLKMTVQPRVRPTLGSPYIWVSSLSLEEIFSTEPLHHLGSLAASDQELIYFQQANPLGREVTDEREKTQVTRTE